MNHKVKMSIGGAMTSLMTPEIQRRVSVTVLNVDCSYTGFSETLTTPASCPVVFAKLSDAVFLQTMKLRRLSSYNQPRLLAKRQLSDYLSIFTVVTQRALVLQESVHNDFDKLDYRHYLYAVTRRSGRGFVENNCRSAMCRSVQRRQVPRDKAYR
jgi:hypothetical protein